MNVLIQTIRVWSIESPEDLTHPDDVLDWSYDLSIEDIETQGSLQDATTDHAEIDE